MNITKIQDFTKKVKDVAAEGLKDASDFAKKTAEDIADGLDNAKEFIQENIRDSVISSKAVKGIGECIKMLDEMGNASPNEATEKAIKEAIDDLKQVAKTIKDNPADSIESIDNVIEAFQNRLFTLGDMGETKYEKLGAQILEKCYEECVSACQMARNVIEESTCLEEQEENDVLKEE